jgi:type IX secretion system PorP/SprF family membrane protein
MKRKALYLFFVMLSGIGTFGSAVAQDIHLSQFYMSPLTENPAMTGALYDMEAILNYKNQWMSVATPYTTMAFSYDLRLTKKKRQRGFWAGGLNVYQDKAGDAQLKILQANLNVAYHLHINAYNTIGAGLQGGFVQHSVGYGSLQWGNQYNGSTYDPGLGSGELVPATTRNFIDAAAGLVWTYNNTAGSINVTDNHDLKINAGLSVFHPQQSKYSYFNDGEKLYMKYVFHGDARISIPNSTLAVVPGCMISRQGSAIELYAGSLLRYKIKQDSKYTGFAKGAAISIGGYYRAADAVALVLMFEYANYSLGMSYDLNTSKLRTASSMRGGFEVSLRFVTPNPFLKKSSSSILYQTN